MVLGEDLSICDSETSLRLALGSVWGLGNLSLAWIAADVRSGCEAERANEDVNGQWKERENRNYHKFTG